VKVLSLKLKEEVFKEVESVVHAIHVPRNAYINEALNFYNKLYKRRLLRERLRKESKAVRESSLEVLGEFERFEEGLS
jgi:hypothetical protein